MILRWTVAAVVALSLVACGVKSPLVHAERHAGRQEAARSLAAAAATRSMNHFHYRNGVLCAEDVPLPLLADAVGTPFYCYSTATLTRHYRCSRPPCRNRR